MVAVWDPDLYARYRDHRSRPFYDLVAAVLAEEPRYVVDLGCGSGELTASLGRRWPTARVEGVDNSASMLKQAPIGDRVAFTLADVSQWQPTQPIDVVISNACLQWVDGHEEVLRRLAGQLSPGGWLAVQVPGNFTAPSHTLLRSLAARWLPSLVLRTDPVLEPSGYWTLLTEAGCVVTAWETTYLQLLTGPDPVLEWTRGTALRPVLAAFGDQPPDEFLAEYAEALCAAYPPGPHGTLFPFRRIFAVAQRVDDN